jgi:hypothetical protein
VSPRFFPEYDNLFLGHADRSRVAPDEAVEVVFPKGPFKGPFSVDGFIAGFWRVERIRESATLIMEPFFKLPKRDRPEVVEEATSLLAFVLPDVDARDVQVVTPS